MPQRVSILQIRVDVRPRKWKCVRARERSGNLNEEEMRGSGADPQNSGKSRGERGCESGDCLKRLGAMSRLPPGGARKQWLREKGGACSLPEAGGGDRNTWRMMPHYLPFPDPTPTPPHPTLPNPTLPNPTLPYPDLTRKRCPRFGCQWSGLGCGGQAESGA